MPISLPTWDSSLVPSCLLVLPICEQCVWVPYLLGPGHLSKEKSHRLQKRAQLWCWTISGLIPALPFTSSEALSLFLQLLVFSKLIWRMGGIKSMLGGYMKIRHHLYSTMLVPLTHIIQPSFAFDLWLRCWPNPHLLIPKPSKKFQSKVGNSCVGYITA